MHIREWPAGERPREKLLGQGAAALSDAELLAIFHAPLERLHEEFVALAEERATSTEKPVLHLLAHTLTYSVSIAFHAWASDPSITQDQLVVRARSHVDQLRTLLES